MQTDVEKQATTVNGIRGWLILPAIGFFLSPITLMQSLAQLDSLVRQGGWNGIFDKWLRTEDAAMRNTEIILFLFCIFTAVWFFRKNRAAPKLVIALMCTSLIYYIIKIFVFASWSSRYEDLVPTMLVTLVFQVITISVWVQYFRKSKRVKATFVR
jgi:hypothetical protein